MEKWGDWKITDEQAQAIYKGDKSARDKFYFDNLDRVRSMAYSHCLKRPYCRGWREDMIDGVYLDLMIFESAVNQPVTDVWRLRKFIYASFNACPKGGLVYLYAQNRKLLSGNKEYNAPVDVLPLDAPINFSNALHNHDGGHIATVADTIPTVEYPSEERYDDVKEIACRYLSPRAADYIKHYVEGYGRSEIVALTGDKRMTFTFAKQGLISHYKSILADLSIMGFNVDYYEKIDPNVKTEKQYKHSPEEREKRRLWAQRWREKRKATRGTPHDPRPAA